MSIDLFKGISRDELMAELGSQLRKLSEEATCCSWDYRIIEEVPTLCYAVAKRGVAGDYLGTPVSLPLARWLVSMAEELGHWVDSDEKTVWQPYVPQAMKALNNE